MERVRMIARRGWKLVCDNKLSVVAIVCVVIFLALLEDVREGDLMRLDAYAYSFFVAYLRSDMLTPVMESFSNLADPICLLVMLLLVSAFAPGRRPGLCAAANLALVIILNQVLKGIVQRARPDGFRLIAESGYSFPSGHSMVAMGFYGLLAWMCWRYYKDEPTMRWIYCTALGIVVVMIGVSRVYLGVHYASDVIAGFCVSMAWLVFYTRVICPLFLPEMPTVGKTPSKEPANI